MVGPPAHPPKVTAGRRSATPYELPAACPTDILNGRRSQKFTTGVHIAAGWSATTRHPAGEPTYDIAKAKRCLAKSGRVKFRG